MPKLREHKDNEDRPSKQGTLRGLSCFYQHFHVFHSDRHLLGAQGRYPEEQPLLRMQLRMEMTVCSTAMRIPSQTTMKQRLAAATAVFLANDSELLERRVSRLFF